LYLFRALLNVAVVFGGNHGDVVSVSAVAAVAGGQNKFLKKIDRC
jgi:hypothetical protein